MKDTTTGTPLPTGIEEAADHILLHIDGRQTLSAETVAVVAAACDQAEDQGGRAKLIVQVSGAPGRPRARGLTVSLVNKWEQVLRHVERLPAATIAVATGDCGGLALDAFLAVDYRIVTRSARLLVPVEDGATWPGMALFRLAKHGANAAVIRRAVLFGTPVEAADGLALNLVDEVVDDPAEAVAVAVERSGVVAGTELAIRRQLLLDAPTTSFEEALGVHLAACDRALRRAAAAGGRS
ncbi:enoyl-CoA-hydratase DpgB [Streptomyces arboris]|uniref:Enoyl-CoA hydratase/isomerase family protein n=1 Tax=Streptomyces arboris TaxID=2600619 RepID=A0A5N5ESG8_9ACTN|nr:enoyl-CoA-hydratase DpgB [Streptomyces arboris]KAB2593939.1 enoyl-CoA hydratase/isomerase family protein [Streptomyces arboris]